ncbi:hypothetical protein [Acinetobacter sp. MD2(2019)]|uniref:hypothetical protein n=1 Tax=Acinetobacter sp. MD2(2019) TaxID=2605273 RepID=UPI002D1EBCE8|nr:hypothetical protein [Acinetobacter sp. MD2(2019)]MEB3753634.1 hypothetical protein [Acinetobacter sp. MD2(2019)]
MGQSFKVALLVGLVLMLGACKKKSDDATSASDPKVSISAHNPDILPYLNIKTQPAQYALPFCEKKNCIDINIQTVQTQDPWLNQWVEKSQSQVIQSQIVLKQNLSLQQAINAYIKASDDWQQQFSQNQPYRLQMQSRIAAQRNQYVLLQLEVNSKQADIEVKDRQYFFVADRKQQKNLSILDVIEPMQQPQVDAWVQKAYQTWLQQQPENAQQLAPKKLYWGQAEWFFDGEGVGLHFRANEIVKNSKQLDIFLSKQQTQQALKATVFQRMF